MYIYTYICVYLSHCHLYICTRALKKTLYVYIYIYTHTHIHVCVPLALLCSSRPI